MSEASDRLNYNLVKTHLPQQYERIVAFCSTCNPAGMEVRERAKIERFVMEQVAATLFRFKEDFS
jgi:hypothetical protein